MENDKTNSGTDKTISDKNATEEKVKVFCSNENCKAEVSDGVASFSKSKHKKILCRACQELEDKAKKGDKVEPKDTTADIKDKKVVPEENKPIVEENKPIVDKKPEVIIPIQDAKKEKGDKFGYAQVSLKRFVGMTIYPDKKRYFTPEIVIDKTWKSKIQCSKRCPVGKGKLEVPGNIAFIKVIFDETIMEWSD